MGCCLSLDDSYQAHKHRKHSNDTELSHVNVVNSVKSVNRGKTDKPIKNMSEKQPSYLGLPDTLYAAPPGPPPSHKRHDWESAVPDNSLLPPPPMLGWDSSPTNNASESDADRGLAWCARHPLIKPITLAPQGRETVEAGIYGLSLPPKFNDAREVAKGRYLITTQRGTPDTCMTSVLPMYCVSIHSPITAHQPKTIYFEVKNGTKFPAEADFGLGFVAAPYPPFRLPGWERGSLGIHGDDGHRYINDRWGGRDCSPPLEPFKAGETIGIGMTFTARNANAPPEYGNTPLPQRTLEQTSINVEIFYTRNGKRVGGWNLHEEKDSEQEMPVTGLEGMHDLYASVGMFEGNQFEIVFNEQDWLYKPW